MTLREKQSEFVRMVGLLIEYAYNNGYELTFGHAMRCVDCPTGHKHSLHKKRLAVDLNIFRNGEYLTDGSGHRQLHQYWSMLGGATSIGKDLNHYSMEHEGMI
jgi:hypothetical protein